MPCLWRKFITWIISFAMLVFCFYESCCFRRCSTSYNDIFTYYITMQRVGGQVTAPTIKTMFGWRYFDNIVISLLKSRSSYSLMLGLKTFLTATSNPWYYPLWMVLNPPMEICSPITKSFNFISRTPFFDSFYFSFIIPFSRRLCEVILIFAYVLNGFSSHTVFCALFCFGF